MASSTTDAAEFPDIFGNPLPIFCTVLPGNPNQQMQLAITGSELVTLHNALCYAASAMQDTADEVREVAGDEHAHQWEAKAEEYRNVSRQTERIIKQNEKRAAKAATAATAAPAPRPEPPSARDRMQEGVTLLDKIGKLIITFVIIAALTLAIATPQRP